MKIEFSFEHPISCSDLLRSLPLAISDSFLSRLLEGNTLYLLQDGDMSELILIETVDCYLRQNYIASSILGYSLIERTIAGRLYHSRENKLATSRSSTLIYDHALKLKWLSEQEHTEIKNIRDQVRNPLIHFKEHSDDLRPETKAFERKQNLHDYLKTLSERTLRLLICQLIKTSL